MIWLLDMVEDHRAAVKYDLLAHGFRLEWLASPALPWGDAVTVLSMQPPAASALYRELHPDLFDRDAAVERLELIAVLLARGQMLLGKQSDVSDADLPSSFDDIYERPREADAADNVVSLLTFAEIDARLGWVN